MGHALEHEHVYDRLQQRLDVNITGAPASPVFFQILKLLYSPQEAEIARQLPTLPTSLDKLARKLLLLPETATTRTYFQMILQVT